MNRKAVHKMLSSYLRNKKYIEVNGPDPELSESIRKLEKAVDVLEDSKKQIIKLYYFENKTMSEVVAKVCYTRQWCHVLRNKGIDDLVDLLS